MIDAVVLAGAPNTGALKDVSPAENEALVQVNGRTMLEYVVDALAGSPAVGKVIVVGPSDLLKSHLTYNDVVYAGDGGSLLANMRLGLSVITPGSMALVATSDIPLLTSEAVTDFITRCSGSDYDVYYSLVERCVADKAYPGVQRTYFRLLDGEYTGGNIILMKPQAFLDNIASIEQAIELRKKPLQLASLLGITFILKFIFRRLAISDIEARVESMLGLKGKGIVTPFPEVGVDVDKPSDLVLISSILK